MAYESKKGLDLVKEQPGTKQKVAPKKGELKNEMADNSVQTGLDHPQHQYETYKRPRKDS